MDINIHVLTAGSLLSEDQARIKNESTAAIKLVQQRLPVAHVDIVVYDDPTATIPEIGIGGWTSNANIIFVPLDPTHSMFEAAIGVA